MSSLLQFVPKLLSAGLQTTSPIIGGLYATTIRTYIRNHFPRPSERKRILRHGWKARMSTPSGRRVLMNRILKGNKYTYYYNYSVYFNDIAVLKLKEPVDITNYVRPCCLWEDSVDIDPVLNQLGTVVGWGFDERRQISDTLMQAQMPVFSTVNCIYSNREFFSQFTFEKTYCAGFRNGTTVCNGDSGGGMVFPKSGTSGQNTIWQIRGIVSVGVALQGQGFRDPRHYIVFTDVAKHLDWIRECMRE